MNQANRILKRKDDIDVLVEDLLADPARAGELKYVLRRGLAVRPVRLPAQDEGDDLWDNVPV